MAISRALTGQEKGGKDPREHPFTKSIREEVRKKLTEYDRHLLSGDSRQSESKSSAVPGQRAQKAKVIPLARSLARVSPLSAAVLHRVDFVNLACMAFRVLPLFHAEIDLLEF